MKNNHGFLFHHAYFHIESFSYIDWEKSKINRDNTKAPVNYDENT